MLALFCTILGHSVFNWALKYVKATVVSVAILGEPIGAAIWAFIIFREIPDVMLILGGIFIIIGLIIFFIFQNDKQIIIMQKSQKLVK